MNSNRTPSRSTPHHPGSLKPLCYALLLCFATATQANPTAPTVINGSVQFDQAGSTLNISNSPNAIINWQSFSIGNNETTRFIQNNAASSVLNRVVGQEMSSLLGRMESNGKVWLINPSGILIGRDAQINVGGLVASTLDVLDTDFLAGRMNFNGNTGAGLENQGHIDISAGGGVYLLGDSVENSGIISAPSGEVVLASGRKIEIGQPGTPNLSVQIEAADNRAVNLGQIITQGGSSNIFAALIDQKGVINAGGAVREGGRIVLRAGKQVKLDSGSQTIADSGNAEGGDIDISAGFVALGGTVSVDGASGGTIKVDAGGGLSLAENVSARGLAGKGGSVSYHSGGQTLETSTSHTDVSGATDGGNIMTNAGGGLLSSGQYLARGETGVGGRIDISGDFVRLFGDKIDASGQTQGGLVRIGGAFQGGKTQPDGSAQSVVFLERWGELDPIAHSARTFINDSSAIDVSARDGSKHGGTAIVWSDAETTFLGSVVAPGGAVEISAAGDLRHVNLNALDLAGGSLLLDPKNIVIGDSATASSWTWQALIGGGYSGSKNVSLSNIDIGEERIDNFGSSVALNDAGDRLAVGAYGDDGYGNDAINAGAVYLFSFTDGNFSGGALQAILGKGYGGGKNVDVANLETGDTLSAVSLNGIGNRLAVGATNDAGVDNGVSNAGAVYLFSFSDNAFSGGTVEGIIGRGYSGGKNLSLSQLETGDSFGASVSLNSAGDRLAVGAENDAGPGNATPDSGAVYLFSFSDGNFSNPSHVSTLGTGYSGGNNLSIGNLEAGDYFGVGVALNASGDRLIVGAPFDQGFGNATGTDTGAVYLFSFADTSFSTPTLQGILGSGYSGGKSLSVTALQSGDQFGTSVDMANNRIAVGAIGDDGSGWHGLNWATGAVYLFSASDSTYTGLAQEAVLGYRYSGGKNLNLPNLGDGGEYGDAFGYGVALNANADRLVVGAPGQDNESGTVTAFTFTDTSFSGGQQAALIGKNSVGGKNVGVDNLEGTNLINGDMFGFRVALNANADRLAVGAPGDDGFGNSHEDSGAVYLFSFSDSNWNGATLQGIVGKGYSGGKNVDVSTLDVGDWFGFSLALNDTGNRLAVGAPSDDGSGNSDNEFGAVYAFSFSDNSFSGGNLEGILGKGYSGGKNVDVSALQAFDNFGWSVALNAANDRLAVGAQGDDGVDDIATPDAGAVYLFSFSDSQFSGGALTARIGSGYTGGKNIDVSGLSDRAAFGYGVSLNAVGDRLAIGSEDDNLNGNAGSVYLYSFTDSNFSGGNLEAMLGLGYTGGKNFNVTNAEDEDGFGFSVSLNATGDRLAVGAPWDDGSGNSVSDIGAVYLFSFSDTLFSGATQQAVIGEEYIGGKNFSTSDIGSSDGGEWWGSGVALNASGNRLAVGAAIEEGPSSIDPTGAVRLFSFTDTLFSGGSLQSSLGVGLSGGKNLDMSAYLDRGGFGNDFFGVGVALNGAGDRLAIGALGDDGADNATPDAGAVYLFTFDDTDFNGGQLAGIVGKGYSGGKNVDVSALEGGDAFGWSVSLNGTGDRMAVGAPGDDGSGNSVINAGAAYLFSFSDADFSGGTLQATVGAGYSGGKNIDVSGLGANDWFANLALNALGDRLAVGAQLDDGSGNAFTDSGAVYLFSFGDGNFGSGVQQAIIGKGYSGGKNVDAAVVRTGDTFGQSVALNGAGDRLVASSEDHDGFTGTVTNSGAVFLYSFSDTTFSGGTLQGVIGNGYVGAKDFDTSAYFTDYSHAGSRIAMNSAGDRLVLADTENDGNGGVSPFSGAVFMFSFSDGDFSGANLEGRIGVGYSGGKNVDMTGIVVDDDEFGLVAMNGNGDRLAVGSWTNDRIGVHLFTFSDTSFSGGQWQGVIGPGVSGNGVNAATLQSGDFFGQSVALNAVGDRLAVGAPGDAGLGNTDAGVGAVYLYSFSDASFSGGSLQAILGKGYSGGKNIDVAALEADDKFGNSVALNSAGDRLAAGATGDDGSGNATLNSGAVYLFTFGDTDFNGGSLQATLGAGYAGGKNIDVGALEANDVFGRSVTFNATGDRLAAGAFGDAGLGNATPGSGAVYLFSFSDSSFSGGSLLATLGKGYSGGQNVDVSGLESGDRFGTSVSLNATGNRMAVGAQGDAGIGNATPSAGAVYLFNFSDTSFSGGSLQATLGKGYSGGKNVDVSALESADGFGNSVSLNATGSRMAVGTPGDDGAGNIAFITGAVYLFDFSDTSFSAGNLQATLGYGYAGTADVNLGSLDDGDFFGFTVSLNAAGDLLAVGASGDIGFNNSVGPNTGAVYLFVDNSPPASVGSLTYADHSGSTVNIDRTALSNLLSTGANVTLQASNDITLQAGGGINVNNGLGNGGDLALHAGRSILLNADIITDNGNLELIANDFLTSGVVDADRDAGAAVIQMAPGTSIDSGTGSIDITLALGTGKTNLTSGDIELANISGEALLVVNDGPSAGSDIVFSNIVSMSQTVNAQTQTGGIVLASGAELNAFGADTAMTLSGQTFSNAAGATALVTLAGSRWLVYSTNPANDVHGGLFTTMKRYNCTLAAGCLTPGVTIPTFNDGFIYSIAPVIALTADSQAVTYGSVVPDTFFYQASGFIDGDGPAEVSGMLGRAHGTLSTGGHENAGIYAMNQGTVASDLGYSFTFAGANLTINPLALSVAGQSVNNKVYDAGPSASTVGGTLSDVQMGDAVGFSTVATFGDKNVGSAKPVSLNHTLSGADAGNYTLADGIGSADITPLSIDATNITAQNKVYDGGVAATLNTAAAGLAGTIGGDVVSLDTSGASGAFADKNVGSAKAVSVLNLALSGSGAGNYTLNAYVTSADITTRAISASGILANDKVYDATPNATLNTAAAALVGAVGGDLVGLDTAVASGVFADKHVGVAKPVSINNLTLTGTDAGNYTLNAYSDSADITARPISASGIIAQDKIYDATSVATLDTAAAGLSGAIGGDAVSLNTATASGAFADKNVGTGKTVSVSGLALAGADAGNYTLNTYSDSADISPRDLQVALTGSVSKVYDAGNSANVQPANLLFTGVQGSDSLGLTLSAATYGDADVGNAKTVSASWASNALTGADAGNYQLLNLSANANIGVITQAVLSYVADQVDLLYGQAFPTAFSGTVEGFVGGETLASATTGVLQWTALAAPDAGPGQYAIEGGGLSAQNYYFEQSPGNAIALRIAPPDVPVANDNLQVVASTTEKAATPEAQQSTTTEAVEIPVLDVPDSDDAAIIAQARSDTGLAVNTATLSRDDLSVLLQERHAFKSELFQPALQALEKDPGLAEVKVCAGGADGDAVAAKGGCMKLKSAKATKRGNLRQPKAASLPQIERKIALLIGINDYTHGIPRLSGAIPDAEAVGNLLEKQLGYETRVLRDAGKQDIVRAMNELADELDANDSVTVYYAGHGYQDEQTRRGYWIPRDAAINNPSNWLSSQDVSRMLANLPAQQVMLVSDSCFSGAFTKEQPVATAGAKGGVNANAMVNANDLLKKRSVMVMSSGGEEPVADTGREGHSIFAWQFMESLRGVQQWTAGVSLFDVVRDKVAREVPQTPQYGASMSAGHTYGGDYLFEQREY